MVEIIAIDGPASAEVIIGKKMSDFYNSFLLSGKLYRAVAYEIMKKIKSVIKNILKILNSLNIKKLNSNNLYSVK